MIPVLSYILMTLYIDKITITINLDTLGVYKDAQFTSAI